MTAGKTIGQIKTRREKSKTDSKFDNMEIKKETAIELPGDVAAIIRILEESGYEAYAVGGCVRDSLLGREPGDWDVTTSATPEEIKETFHATVDTGIEHGTVTVIFKGTGYEVTTYRIDGEYTDGRHPDKVTFSRSLEEDVKRRDFTINAMAYNPSTGLRDLFGGCDDLRAGVIRCVGEPDLRFGEDALRMLRAIRFAATLGFRIEEETYRSICDLHKNIAAVSRERIQVEVNKLIASDHPELITLTKATGLADDILPALAEATDETVQHIEEILPMLEPDKTMRLGALFSLIGGEETRKILRSLKYDNQTTAKVSVIARMAYAPIEEDKTEIRRRMHEIGRELYPSYLKVRRSLGAIGALGEDIPGIMQAFEKIEAMHREIVDAGDCVEIAELAIGGRELAEIGVAPGPKMGEILKELLAHVIEEPDDNRRDILLGIAGKLR